MGTLAFVCPTTGHEVSTGVEIDRSNYKRLRGQRQRFFGLRCHKNHMLAVIWAWLADDVPQAPEFPLSLLFALKRSSPIREPCRSRGAMPWRGTPPASARPEGRL